MQRVSPDSTSLHVHGVFVDVFEVGVLIIGASGIGKSELALGLLNHGHKLIADDITYFQRNAQNEIIGQCPAPLQDFLEVRGIGILNVRSMFGDQGITIQKQLELLVHIKDTKKIELCDLDRLQGMKRKHKILNIGMPEITIPVAAGRNLAMLVEAAVRNHQLCKQGYNAYDEFMARHKDYLAIDAQAVADDREFLDDD